MEFLSGVGVTLVGVVGAYVVWLLQRHQQRRERSRDDLRNALKEYFLETTESGWWLAGVLKRSDLPHGERVRLREEAAKRADKLHMAWDIAMSNIDNEDLLAAVNDLDGVTQQVFREFADEDLAPDLDPLRERRHALKSVAKRELKLRL